MVGRREPIFLPSSLPGSVALIASRTTRPPPRRALLFSAAHVECRACLSDKLPRRGNTQSNEGSATAIFSPAASARWGLNGSWRQSSEALTAWPTHSSRALRI
jgi:hypothetical protein